MLYTLVTQFYLKRKRKKDDIFYRKKTDKKQNSATTIISVDGKGTVFLAKLKLQWEPFE